MKYLEIGIFFLIILAVLYLSVTLLIKAKGSLLYSRASLIGIFSIFNGLVYVIMIDNNSIVLGIVKRVIIGVIAILFYQLWQVTFNQLNVKFHQYTIYTLGFIDLVLNILISLKLVSFQPIIILNDYLVIPLIIMSLTFLGFLKHSKLSRTRELRFVPLIIFLYVLGMINQIMIQPSIVLPLKITDQLLILLLLMAYYKDYRNSFYY